MRGIASQGMVMCSATEDNSKFEILDPPDGSVPGDRVSFEGYPGEPDKQLNPKKKVNITNGFNNGSAPNGLIERSRTRKL